MGLDMELHQVEITHLYFYMRRLRLRTVLKKKFLAVKYHINVMLVRKMFKKMKSLFAQRCEDLSLKHKNAEIHHTSMFIRVKRRHFLRRFRCYCLREIAFRRLINETRDMREYRNQRISFDAILHEYNHQNIQEVETIRAESHLSQYKKSIAIKYWRNRMKEVHSQRSYICQTHNYRMEVIISASDLEMNLNEEESSDDHVNRKINRGFNKHVAHYFLPIFTIHQKMRRILMKWKKYAREKKKTLRKIQRNNQTQSRSPGVPE